MTSEREAELQAGRLGKVEVHGKPIELVDYDPAWPGSTSAKPRRSVPRSASGPSGSGTRLDVVPGLAAKPIIDIVLIVADSADEDAYVPALEAAGYELTIRERDWHEHRALKGTDPRVNLHVFSDGCPEIERMTPSAIG